MGFKNYIKFIAITVTLASALCSAPPVLASDESVERAGRLMRIKYLFNMKKFDELEALHQRYLTEQSRIPSGIWDLTLFHAALNLKLFDRPGQKGMDESGYEPFFTEWLERYPKSEAAHLMRARVFFNKIDQIFEMIEYEQPSPNQRRLIEEYLVSMEHYISRHRSPDARDPHWDQLNIELATRRGVDKSYIEKLAKGAFDRSPYFYENYFQVVHYYVKYSENPVLDIEKLAREAVKRTKDKEGAGLYSRIYWVASSHYEEQIFTKGQVDWKLMKTGMNDVLARWNADWNRSAFAKFSCWKRDRKAAAMFMDKLENPNIAGIWGSRPPFIECKDFIASKSAAKR